MALDLENFLGGRGGADEASHGQIFSWIRACNKRPLDSQKPLTFCESPCVHNLKFLEN